MIKYKIYNCFFHSFFSYSDKSESLIMLFDEKASVGSFLGKLGMELSDRFLFFRQCTRAANARTRMIMNSAAAIEK